MLLLIHVRLSRREEFAAGLDVAIVGEASASADGPLVS